MKRLKEKENLELKVKDKDKSYQKKIIVIFLVIVLIVMFGGLAVFLHYNNHLTEDEKMVAKVVKTYHDNLKNPDSMKIFEIRIYNNKEKKMKMILMDAAGQNGFGGNTRNIVAYTDDIKYIGDDSEADTELSKYADNSNEIVISRLIYETWYNSGKYISLGTSEYISVNVNKILNNYEKIK